MVLGQRFDFEDVQAGAGNFSRLQGSGEVGEIDNDPAADVDQVGGLLLFAG